jgi:hypothetical protein
MTIDQIRRLYEAQPFRPFTMHLADGRQLPPAVEGALKAPQEA